MANFEKCPCGERASHYCGSCSTKKCFYCVQQRYCTSCVDKRHAKSLADLHTKTKILIARMEALEAMWRGFDNDVTHDDKYNEKATVPLHLLTIATKYIRDIYEENDDKSTTAK